MNCQTIQNKVLALPDPRKVPEPLRTHLDACPACLGWWHQAVRLERLLEQLPAPIPPADKKAVLVEELNTAGPIIKSVPTAGRGTAPARQFLTRRTAAYAGGLAAAVLVAIGVARLFTSPPPGKPDVVVLPRHPLLEKIVQRDVALAREASPEERLKILGGLADDLLAETQSLARVASPEDLDELAETFHMVVNDGIVTRAQKLPLRLTPDQRAALLAGLADRLARAGTQAEQIRRESPPGSQPALQRIANIARDGQKRLLALARS